jgi:hypothetical protein
VRGCHPRCLGDEIINTVLTGASNATSEGVNRIQKLDARAAFGYRNPETNAAAPASPPATRQDDHA